VSDRSVTDTTATSSQVHALPAVERTRTSGELLAEVAAVAEHAGHLRARARLLSEDTGQAHRDSLDLLVGARTAERARSGLRTLLATLNDFGFAWRDIARLLHVSVPTIRKWRTGENATAEHRNAAARLVAVCEIIAESCMIEDIASWFEIPLLEGAGITTLDLYEAGRIDLVLEHAHQHRDTTEILDDFDSEWRTRTSSRFEVFDAPDGQPAIRVRGGDAGD
jgi:hypothetical protein